MHHFVIQSFFVTETGCRQKMSRIISHLVGSSTNIIGGLVISSTPIDSRFFSPPDKHSTDVCSVLVSPSISNMFDTTELKRKTELLILSVKRISRFNVFTHI